MSDCPLYPLLVEPALHVKVWGGRRLAAVMGKSLPTDEPYGESWEIHDTATVASGPLAGRALGDLLSEYGARLIGPDGSAADGLPLLVKLIDASDWLSVQVHPNDDQARQLEGQPRGKTEAWYVLAADPGARLVIGVTPGATRAELAHAIRGGSLERLLVYETVEAGDVLFIPAGTIHALGPGILVYEIQQSSDTTYRMYDWGRLGLDGQPRALHIEKSLAVANTEALPRVLHTRRRAEPVLDLVGSPFFTTRLYHLAGEPVALDTAGRRFHTLTCVEGEAVVSAGGEPVAMRLGQSVFVPACLGPYTVSGSGRLLCSAQSG